MIKISRIFLAVTIIVISGAHSTMPAHASDCDDVKFVFARGSGEELGGPSMTEWQKEVTARVKNSGIKYGFYELGTREYGGGKYEAVPVAGSLTGIANLVGAAVSAGESYKFGDSVKKGEKELITYIQVVSNSCPNTKFVLGGYSQGAMLVSRALNYINAEKVIYVTNFGDPKTYLPEGRGNFPDACQGKNLSNYRAHVSDCHAYEGILGSYRPYQPEGYYNKIGLWCNGQDAMCSSGLSISDHTSYVSNGMYKRAAAKIAERLKQAFPENNDFAFSPTEINSQDVAIILDTSPQMMQTSYYTHLVRIRQLVNEVRSLGGRIALFYYGDSRYFKTKCICDFNTCNEDKINEFYNEYAKIGIIGHWGVNSALSATRKALEELDWRQDAPKSIVIFTDERMYTPDCNGTVAESVLEANQKIGGAAISVYSLHNLFSFGPLVEPTGGKFYIEDENATALTSDITNVAPLELPSSEYIATTNQEIFLDASHLASELRASIPRSISRNATSSDIHFDWDLDGDGIFEVTDGKAQMSIKFDQPKESFVQVRVRDDRGNYRIALSTVKILNSSPDASISSLTLEAKATKIDDNSYRIDLESEAPWLLLTIDDVVMGRINPRNSKSIIINDITRLTTIHLTAYSDEEGRGESREMILGEGLPANEENKNVDKLDLSTMPKAPNAGIYLPNVS